MNTPLGKFLLSFVLTGYLFLGSGKCYSLDEAIVVKDRINVRVDATAMAPSLGFLKRGERVAIADERFDWYKIVLPKRFSAYAAAEFLKDEDTNKVEVTASSLNLRSQPSMSSYVIGRVEKGTVFFVRSSKGDWFEIRGYPHIYGWVNKNFLEKTEKLLKLEGTLFSYNGADCEANYILKTENNNKYFLNITTKGKTKFISRKVRIEGIENKGTCPYVVVYKLVFTR
ncbi:MAG: SH3 domain-containing protein [Candidatus Omnitrophica bacterium]|nr:SH3 domain-containing protein [Candidatus Omnitrophota bacterium]